MFDISMYWSLLFFIVVTFTTVFTILFRVIEKSTVNTVVRQEIIASNCLLTSQVTEFCNLFKSEKSKLAFAKYAYKFTIDRKNYSAVNKALSLETSKKELNKFINGG